jgi:hypothetical protein
MTRRTGQSQRLALVITDNVAGSPQSVALSGTGVAAPTTFTTYLGPYGSGLESFSAASVALPIRAYYPSGASQIGYVETYLINSAGTTEYSVLVETNNSGASYWLEIEDSSGYAPSSPLTMTASGNTVTLTTPISLGTVQITAYRFALSGNEFQLDLTITRSGTFSDQIVIDAVNGTNYSAPWGASAGTWN